MSTPYSSSLASSGDPGLPRTVSAPPSLDYRMLFAFSSEYAPVFSKTPYPNPPESLVKTQSTLSDKSSLLQDSDEAQLKSHSTNDLVNQVVNDCIKDDDSPVHTETGFFPEFPMSVNGYEFMESGYYPYSLQSHTSMYTQALEMAKDQMGCRLLQKKLEERNPFTIQTIYEQVVPSFAQLMVDPFGNYLCQKLMEVCEPESLEQILEKVCPTITAISLNTHGTRAVQKLIEVVAPHPTKIPKLVSALKSEVISLINDLNGNHVIQRCLYALGAPHDQFIYETVSKNIKKIATHRHGCCVLQRCIDAASAWQRSALVDKVVENAVELVQDAFGNYVVQYVLDLNNQNTNSRLAYIFIEGMEELSTQKFSSNVIEKCLQQNSFEIQQAMIKEIGKKENVAKMIGDQYANYVVQRALSLAPKALLHQLLKEVKVHLEELKKSQCGKRIYSKLVKKYPELLKRDNV